MICRANALPEPLDGFPNACLKRLKSPAVPDIYNLRPLSGDFSLLFWNAGLSDQTGALVFFLGAPDGEIVNNALVIATIVDQGGVQQMFRARPRKGGYLVEAAHLKRGQYRLEIEIVTRGWLLTDELHFHKV